ncbi:GntR family transcriptional regulator [Sellimonas caecigallum]|uniref:GntR family transcriptional regulator n=1 Tax=Sellimonas caecigallum TaxID=2592333 RepID=A0ABS7L7Z4_9FIRM|nr:GntR family transcriptional regulator [Sellimonas caecigallum]MBY0759169.1 GntR family transcriptional regulator [Sellimonas caecigallum]
MAAPRYLEIKKRIMKEIEGKPVSTPIASERELAVQFDASRMTVRKALNELVEEGYLYRNKNKGTFVAERSLHKKNTAADSFLKKEETNHKLLYFNVKEIPDAAKRLNLPADELILRAVRLTLNDERPVTIEEIFLPYKSVDYNEMNEINTILDMNPYIQNGRLTQRFIPMLIPSQYSNLLEVKMGTPIIMVDSIIYDPAGNPVALVNLYHNPREKIIEITS